VLPEDLSSFQQTLLPLFRAPTVERSVAPTALEAVVVVAWRLAWVPHPPTVPSRPYQSTEDRRGVVEAASLLVVDKPTVTQ
jgi:hypothetical protein